MEQSGKLYKSIKTAATTVVKDTAGTLHSITIAGGTLGAVTVYDDGDGTVASGLEIISTFTPAGALQFTFPNGGLKFVKGLTIVTAAATVVTVQYS